MGPITGRNDSRITRVGRYLRKTKLDELPQFVNVLFGDMTLVGPRPESPEIVALYTSSHRAVLRVKPGITGRVQLDSRDESQSIPHGIDAREYYLQHLMQRKLDEDLDYLKARTPMTDARIVFQTATFVVRSFFESAR
jgi:lipopolysaccharide/colanic/teichoic acid biosynthesis glycosyltransferase